eukprot:TRINITY_DN17348_c0_g1_i1.p1 TRINITY_DN17348_c0_g1~~TRINITY_DN17348_c0_g1_i1.p1  ORF type:complete len:152 (-),score=30.88 TRINITY_DN17348_c0_g1_i1:142-597(-)
MASAMSAALLRLGRQAAPQPRAAIAFRSLYSGISPAVSAAAAPTGASASALPAPPSLLLLQHMDPNARRAAAEPYWAPPGPLAGAQGASPRLLLPLDVRLPEANLPSDHLRAGMLERRPTLWCWRGHGKRTKLVRKKRRRRMGERVSLRMR